MRKRKREHAVLWQIFLEKNWKKGVFVGNLTPSDQKFLSRGCKIVSPFQIQTDWDFPHFLDFFYFFSRVWRFFFLFFSSRSIPNWIASISSEMRGGKGKIKKTEITKRGRESKWESDGCRVNSSALNFFLVLFYLTVTAAASRVAAESGGARILVFIFFLSLQIIFASPQWVSFTFDLFLSVHLHT